MAKIITCLTDRSEPRLTSAFIHCQYIILITKVHQVMIHISRKLGVLSIKKEIGTPANGK